MLPTQLLGLTFDENGLNCYLMSRAFSLDRIQPGWSIAYMAAYYWSMHYPKRILCRDVGSVPLIHVPAEELFRDWFGVKFELAPSWDGSVGQLRQLQADSAAVIVPSDKHSFIKRFADAYGTDFWLLLDAEDEDELIFYGHPLLIPLMNELHGSSYFNLNGLPAWIPGGAFNLAKVRHLHAFIGDVPSPFSASRVAIYKRNLVLRERYSERYASLQLLRRIDGAEKDPHAALQDYLHSVVDAGEAALLNLVRNKAAYIRQIFVDESLPLKPFESPAQTLALAFVNSQSIAVAGLFLALKMLPCAAEVVKAIDAELHRCLNLWAAALSILANRMLPEAVVESLQQAEWRLLREISSALQQFQSRRSALSSVATA